MAKHVTVLLDDYTHEALQKTAKLHSLNLKGLCSAILEWAGEMDGNEMARSGIRIPVWFEDTN